jgi:hypothetical protein
MSSSLFSLFILLLYLPLPISTAARRITNKEVGRGKGALTGSVHPFFFLAVFQWRRVKGGVLDGFETILRELMGATPSRPSVFKLYPILPIKLFAELPALSELEQPSCKTPRQI